MLKSSWLASDKSFVIIIVHCFHISKRAFKWNSLYFCVVINNLHDLLTQVAWWWYYNRRFMCVEARNRRSHLSWKCITKACSKQSCATNGRRQGLAYTATIVSLLMELRSSAQSSVTLATRLRSAKWSLVVVSVLMAIAVTSAMPSLSRTGSLATSSPGKSSLTGKIMMLMREV